MSSINADKLSSFISSAQVGALWLNALRTSSLRVRRSILIIHFRIQRRKGGGIADGYVICDMDSLWYCSMGQFCMGAFLLIRAIPGLSWILFIACLRALLKPNVCEVCENYLRGCNHRSGKTNSICSLYYWPGVIITDLRRGLDVEQLSYRFIYRYSIIHVRNYDYTCVTR